MRFSGIISSATAAMTVVIAAERLARPIMVRGIGVGSYAREVTRSLGKPAKVVTPASDDEMGMGKLQEFHYPGAVFELCKPEGRSDFHVWRLIVTQPNWRVAPGLRVGMTRDAIIRILGRPEEVSDEGSGRETLHYSFDSFDGWYWISLTEGKVKEIGAAEDWS